MSSDEAPAVDAVRTRWEQFRASCFIAYGGVYVWSAGCPAEFYVLALHLVAVPDFAYEFSGRALVITVFDARHVIPLAQLTSLSLQNLHASLSGQAKSSLEVLRQIVHAKYEFDTPPQDISDAATFH